MISSSCRAMQWRSGLLQRAVFGSTAKSSAWVAHGRVPQADAPVHELLYRNGRTDDTGKWCTTARTL